MKPSDRYKSIEDLPKRVPVFPLMGAILLPDAVLPLNIFEPRYLAMIDDCLSGDRVIGIIQPEGEDGGQTGSPTGRSTHLRGVGCAGRLTSYQETRDGRLLIGLTGLVRFELGAEVGPNTPYRVFDVAYDRFARDLVRGAGEDEVDRAALLATLRRFLAARGLRVDWASIEGAGNEDLVNSLAIASPFGPVDKQGLLEAPTLKARSELLVALAEMELAGASGGSGRLQ